MLCRRTNVNPRNMATKYYKSCMETGREYFVRL